MITNETDGYLKSKTISKGEEDPFCEWNLLLHFKKG